VCIQITNHQAIRNQTAACSRWQNAFERAFMSVYLVFSFSRIVFAIVFKCRTSVQEHAEKVFFQVFWRFCRRMRNILRHAALHF